MAQAAKSARDGDGTMVASPAQATAGSISNIFAFSWRNSNVGKFNAGSQCTLFIPAGWTAPQNTNASHPGYVSVAPVGNASAAINSIAGNTSWTVTVDFTANQSDSHGFNLTYAGGGHGVTAPSVTGLYTFVTQTRQSGGTLTTIATNPVITVTGTATNRSQTIAFPNPGTQRTTNAVGLSATASSGLPVSFEVGSGPASLSGGTNLVFTGTGTVSIVASQAGDENWDPAPGVTNTFSVTKAVAGVTLNNLNQIYDGTPRVVTATTEPPGLAVEITYNGSVTPPVARGSYVVVATVMDANYEGSATGVLVVEPASGGGGGLEPFDNFAHTGSTYASGTFLGQDGSTWAYARARGDLSITGRSPTLEKAKGAYIRSGMIPGGVGALELKYRKAATQPLNCAVHVNGILVGAITVGNGTVLTWTSGVLNIQGDVVLLFSNNVNSGAITLDDISWSGFSSAPAPAVVTLHDLVQTYDGTARIVTATTEPPGLAVDLTYDGSPDAPVNAGSYAVVGTVNDDNYVGSASDILVVNKADQTVAFPNPGPQETTNQVGLSATASSGLGVTFAVISGPGNLTGSTNLNFTGAGVVSLVASQEGDANWNPAPPVTHTFDVTKAVAGVTLNNLDQPYDGTPRVVTAATVPGGLTVDITYDGSATAPTEAGQYAVTGTVNDVMYQGAQAGTLIVGTASAGVDLHDLVQTYDGTARIVTATTEPPGLAVDLTYDGSPDAPVNAGSYAVVGTVNDGNHVGSASDILVVNKADQTIAFPNPGPQETTNQVGLSATASSGLGVAFAVVSGPASLTGGTNLAFTGAGVVSLVASQEGDANWNPAPDVTHTFAVSGIYLLTVRSAHGSSEPPTGDHVYAQDTIVTNSAQTPDTSGTTQHVCVGWTMAGHDPESGTTSQFVMTMTNDATLTWQWNTRYWLETEAGSHGAVSVGDGWQGAGVTTPIAAIAEPYYHFSGWTGDATGEANPLDLLMDGSKSVMAHFAENLAALGTPEWWLAQHYPGTTDFDSAELSDTDGDGYLAWQEYVTGNNPTNRFCFLKFCPGRADLLTFMSRTGRLYCIYYKTSLTASTWTLMTNHIEGTGGMVTITNTLPSAFFRLKVGLP